MTMPLNFTLDRTPVTMISPERFKGLRSPAPRPSAPSLLLESMPSLLLESMPSLLLESMPGVALGMLEALSPQERRSRVVVTTNPCPEYAADVWDLGLAVLLIGNPSPEQITRAIDDAANGRRYRQPAAFESSLIPSERAILRFLPQGTCNKRIASRLGLSDRTVRNRLVDIGEKLHLENRTQIAMYYAGQWQWLERYRALMPGIGATPETFGLNPN